jgi:hypothetical protein
VSSGAETGINAGSGAPNPCAGQTGSMSSSSSGNLATTQSNRC